MTQPLLIMAKCLLLHSQTTKRFSQSCCCTDASAQFMEKTPFQTITSGYFWGKVAKRIKCH